ncbi:MAG: SAM-dependent methyltransferase [Hydrogenophilus sp.]|nr:SAM-dependent methyltransferase [Hydrogenophilus sp.]
MVASLLLIPTPIAEEGALHLPAETLVRLHSTRRFLVETPKAARRHLSRLGHPLPPAEWILTPIPPSPDPAWCQMALAPCRAGESVALLTDCGAPAIADPGAAVVAAAHLLSIPVEPLVGPSSLLLALMASGLPAQRFAFHGYLPVKETACRAAIGKLETLSRRDACTQIFIETPYRNDRLLRLLLTVLSPTTRLAIAYHLTAPDGWVRTRTVGEWRHHPPVLARRPVTFLFNAALPPPPDILLPGSAGPTPSKVSSDRQEGAL